MMEFYSSEVYQ